MAGIVAPSSFPIRQPTEKSQMHGRMVNPPRYMELGGFSGPGKWFKEGGGDPQSPQANVAKVERATSVRAAKGSTGMNVDTA